MRRERDVIALLRLVRSLGEEALQDGVEEVTSLLPYFVLVAMDTVLNVASVCGPEESAGPDVLVPPPQVKPAAQQD